MTFALPIRPSRPAGGARPPQLQPPESPRRRPSVATRGGVVKRRKNPLSPLHVPSLSFFEDMFGDEFPDAFPVHKSGKTILDLPTEVLHIVCGFLSNPDIKRLRLSNGHIAREAELHINRVFISPNRANLSCLESILAHSRYPLQIQEIVWDDSQLEKFGSLEEFKDHVGGISLRCLLETQAFIELRTGNLYPDQSPRPDDFLPDEQLTEDSKYKLLQIGNEASRDILELYSSPPMSYEESYDLYQKLYQDEQEIMKRGWDVAALHRALVELPNLKRITLTAQAWNSGSLTVPLFKTMIPKYDTPFSRALPKGFRKPLAWPWLGYGLERTADWFADHWNPRCKKVFLESLEERLPFEWRAYSVIMSSLVSVRHPGIEAVLIDPGEHENGINHQLIAKPNKEYDLTKEACKNIKHFKLAISAYQTHKRGFDYLYSGLLKDLFSSMVDLEHLDFDPNLVHGPIIDQDFESNGGMGLVPSEIFSLETLSRLKHLTLRHFVLSQSNLGWLIDSLTNAESITFDNVKWNFTYHDMLASLKHHITQKASRPRIVIIEQCAGEFPQIGSFVLDEALNDYLYNNGECPVENRSADFLKDGLCWFTSGKSPNPGEYDIFYRHKILPEFMPSWYLEDPGVPSGSSEAMDSDSE